MYKKNGYTFGLWSHKLNTTHSPHLLVPPSEPSCQIQGTLDVGSDIMLLCDSDEGIPTPTYSWEKISTLPKLPQNAVQGMINYSFITSYILFKC